MRSDPTCPICGLTAWKSLGSRTYRPLEYGKASPYVRKRLEILFQIWFPGTTEVTMSSVLCQHCGFVCYLPRPDADDIDRKYAFLADDASTRDEISQELESDERRSLDLYKRLRPYMHSNASVLDFGGGNGRLMLAFLAREHNCYLIDYAGEKLPGVRYLGSQLSDIQAGRKFDLIVCSHVLEHVADPYSAVNALRSYLAPGGVFYVEVPLEIWKKAPLAVEPVTHVNYFTVDSLRILLERAGYSVLTCEEGLFTTENGGQGLAVRAHVKLAEKGAIEIRYEGSASTTLRLTQPSTFHQLARALKYPRLTWWEARRFLYERLGKTPLLWRLLARKPGR